MTRRALPPAALAVAAALMALLCAGPATPAHAARSYVRISGAGSSWSANAIQAWTSTVRGSGMQVDYQSTGSSDGRRQFTNNTVDFGVSEIPYGLSDMGVVDTPPRRGYAYMPIVAGGTAFMYNLRIRGKQVTQLRLSGEVVAKIFTGVITSWSDPAIKAQNPGLALPARRIVPVFRSDGSGTTAQLTLWLSKKYPALWNAYCVKVGRARPGQACGLTSQYPGLAGSGMVGQAGSVGVAGYVSQRTSEGSITYVEYSYALNARFPVVKLLNASGYYVLPTDKNVAVGLLNARINTTPGPSYLTQILDGVYDNRDRRAYPLSSYSYLILPTKVEGSFTEAKGYTLASFAQYFLCKGQANVDDLGYSPLPINLVAAGLDQVRKIPGAEVAAIDIRKCDNPTFSANGTNTLAKTAPMPPACDKAGPRQCGTAVANGGAPVGGGGGTGGGGGGTSGGGTGGGTVGAGGSGGGTGGGVGGGTGGGAGAGTGGLDAGGDPVGGAGGDAGAGGVVDPATGEGGDSSVQAARAEAVPVELTNDYVDGTTRATLMALGVVVALGLALLPPLVARHAAGSRQGGSR